MKYEGNLPLKEIIALTRSSEEKFQQGNFKEAIEDRRNARKILNSGAFDLKTIQIFKNELLNLYNSKFDLINDHKLRISESRKIEIVKLLDKKGNDKYFKGDYKGAIRALRRSDKYFSN